MLNNLNPQDYKSRISDTILRYGDEPVYAYVDDGNNNIIKIRGICTKNRLAHDNWVNIAATDPAFDISFIPLGYCNYNGDATYITRPPQRKWKQGFTEAVSRMYKVSGQPSDLPRGTRSQMVTSKSFFDMVMGNYPSIAEAIEMVTAGEEDRKFRSMAVSRWIAIEALPHKIINVYFKTELIGWLSPLENYTTVHVKNDGKSWVVSKYLGMMDWIVD